MKIMRETGALALAARMQKLGDSIRRDASLIYKEHGIEFESKWFPVVYILSKKSPLGVVELANELGYAHPSVITLVKELQTKKMIKSIGDKKDGRKRMLSLTPKAQGMVKKMEPLWKKMLQVNNQLVNNKHHLLKAIEETEEQLARESFYNRMQKLLRRK
ncbi:MAG: MarR family winged helix-turn-helix transcriptional regulator [Flavobacteriales bacterium]